MTLVEMIGRIRRAHFAQSLSFREIARRFRMSRKTVRKAIEAPEGTVAYERGKFGANPAMSGFCFDINVSC
jgi:AraC-like DNA-binding protein